ncbi:MAG: hypothetical protein IBX47_11710 [Desulfuromonadales bacterium]|nr:hypothetical protein [Desulfuromonadales bacterium]
MKKSLLETNSYLKDQKQRKRLLRQSLVSSFAIEGINLKEDAVEVIKENTPDFIARKTSTSDR